MHWGPWGPWLAPSSTQESPSHVATPPPGTPSFLKPWEQNLIIFISTSNWQEAQFCLEWRQAFMQLYKTLKCFYFVAWKRSILEEHLGFFLYKIKCSVSYSPLPHTALLRKQRKSLLSKLSPIGTKNQITTVNIYSVFPNLSSSCKSFFLFESSLRHWKAFDLHFTEEEKKLKEVMGLPQGPTVSKCLNSDSNPDSLAS